MIYTQLTKVAMRVAYEAHHGQVDKAGVPYIFHPVHLAEQMTDEYTTITALLHDVMEDTSITVDYLAEQGFPDEVLEALLLLTHDQSVTYTDYILALKGNDIAKAVKNADLRHNSDVTRLCVVSEQARARAEKYAQALALLWE